MRTIETQVYQYDELSDRAKGVARDWYRTDVEPGDYADTVLDDAARIGALIGIEIRTRPVKLMGGGTHQEPNVYWSVAGRDSGASFAGSYAYAKGGLAKLRTEAPAQWRDRKTGQTIESESNRELHTIAERLQAVQRRNFYRLQATIAHGHSRSLSLAIDVERADYTTPTDQDIDTVEACLRDFASWIETQLKREYEYQTSDDTVAENIRANEYEFTEDGRRV